MLKLPSGCARPGAGIARISAVRSPSARTIRWVPMMFCRPYGSRGGLDSRRWIAPVGGPRSAREADFAEVAKHARMDQVGPGRRAERVGDGRLLGLGQAARDRTFPAMQCAG